MFSAFKSAVVVATALGAALCCAGPALAAGYSLERQWGAGGTGDGQFGVNGGPQDIATDAAGNVYVTDTNNHRVQQFSGSGRFLAKWGTQGAGAGQFNYPGAIAIDPAGPVYVTDMGNARIQKFTSAGRFLESWDHPAFGTLGALATDPMGNVYVAEHDDAGRRVKKLDPSGRLLTTWQNPVPGPISGLAADATGNLYVGDGHSGNIVKLAPGGARLAEWDARAPTGFYTGSGFQDLAIDASGAMYAIACSANLVSDWLKLDVTRSVRKFTASGTLVTEWTTAQSLEWAFFFTPGHLCWDGGGSASDPNGEFLSVDRFGNVYVSGIFGPIQKFAD